ncbi:Protein-glutamate methylesterase/protein-glutamine glutaminase [Streptomyces violarus]
MAKRERVLRMSVEQPLWRALTAYRVLTMLYAVGLFATAYEEFTRPWVAVGYYAVLGVWTLATLPRVANAARCTKRFLAADLTVAVTGILLTPVADAHERVQAGGPTLPSIWTAGAVLAFAIKGGWRWAALASSLVAVANLIERGSPARDTVHNVILVCIASIAIGYVVEVARASERTLARALEIEAATRERERLARDIHDSVLQVLAMVQRRGAVIGGEAAELGRMAGDQEVALRTLVSGGLVPVSRVSEDAAEGAVVRAVDEQPEESGPVDLRALLAPYAGAKVSLAEPGAPVPLAPVAAREVAAAVGAALDNVRKHAGEQARAWILVEDEPDEVIVTVRDDGPGIPEGRLAQAEGEGRLGVALSIRGRLRDLGGSAELISVPGQGTEVELKVPKDGDERTGEGGAAMTETTEDRRDPIKVMVVDDHPMWRDAVARDLAESGFEVVATAGDGEQAVRRAKAAAPDVLVLDLNLPGKPGVQVCKEVVAADPSLRVLVLSASGEHADVLEAVKSGATGYLLKSASTEELQDAVRRTAVGDPVFTPGLAGLVLGEYRRLASEPRPPPRTPTNRRHPGSPTARPRCCASSPRA